MLYEGAFGFQSNPKASKSNKIVAVLYVFCNRREQRDRKECKTTKFQL